MRGFTGKLSLFKFHAESGNFLHFPFTREVSGGDEKRTEEAKQTLVGILESLLIAFDDRLVDFASIDDVCCLLGSPFTVHLDDVKTVKVVADVWR